MSIGSQIYKKSVQELREFYGFYRQDLPSELANTINKDNITNQEGIQESVRKTDASVLHCDSTRYYFSKFPKPDELFSLDLAAIPDTWVCVEHAYSTNSFTGLLLHSLRHYLGDLL